MIVILSPAKKLDFENNSPTSKFTNPIYLDKSKVLIKQLRQCSAQDISKLMKLSDSLTKLNIERYKTFKTPFTIKNSKQAIFSFIGDTYVGFDATSISQASLNYSQKHLRILSGLYGILAPLDLIQPYRLEMGTKLKTSDCQNLYQFWKEILTSELNNLLKKDKTLINLASKEYFSAIDFNQLNNLVITPIFKQKKGDTSKVVGIFAKRARGMMARYIIDHKINDIDRIKRFNLDGYKFISSESDKNNLVFIR